jgi:hypothetical protein
VVMAWEIVWKMFGTGQGPTSQSHTCFKPKALTGHGRDDVSGNGWLDGGLGGFDLCGSDQT